MLKLAARGGELDLGAEFGVDADRVAAYGRTTQLAIGAGFDALRDAGIPLVMRYKTTHLGTQLPERWGLPDELRDDTGVIFASAFPGIEEFAAETHMPSPPTRPGARSGPSSRPSGSAWRTSTARTSRSKRSTADCTTSRKLDRRRAVRLRPPLPVPRPVDGALPVRRPHRRPRPEHADQLGMRQHDPGRGASPRTGSAPAGAAAWSSWPADDVTSDELLGWFGSGFLATGAAATDDDVAEAAIPFDRRRHGMILGMGAAALVVEAADAARERGVQPICEVLGTATANSAFHGTRLDVDHIGEVMEQLVAGAEARTGIDRHAIAPATVFVSHETYTPARGGSASAEIFALRRVFGADADRIVIANTKGFTGHPMGVGLEDVVAVKALETGHRPAGRQLPRGRPGARPAQPVEGRVVPGRVRPAAGRRVRVADLDAAAAPEPAADGRRRRPDELGYAYRVVDPRTFRRLAARASAATPPPSSRWCSAGCGSSTTAPAPPSPTAVATRPSPDPVAPVTATVPPAPDRPRSRPSTASRRRVGRRGGGADRGAGGRADRLPGRHAGHRPRPRGRSRHRHGEAGRAVRHDPRGVRHRARRQAQAARLPDAQPRRSASSATGAAAPPTAAARPRAGGARGASVDAVAERIVALVAEQTGYPADMLAMDLDLEADLGIDTVKQAELFATIREEYGIERDDKLKLRDYPTLNHVVGFVRDRAPGAHPTAAPSRAPEVPAPCGRSMRWRTRIVALVAEQTGYPADMLALDLDLEADLGIDTVKQAELFAPIREEYGIERDDKLKLRDYPTLNHVVGFVRDRAAGARPPQPSRPPRTPPRRRRRARRRRSADGFPRRVPVVVAPPARSSTARRRASRSAPAAASSCWPTPGRRPSPRRRGCASSASRRSSSTTPPTPRRSSRGSRPGGRPARSPACTGCRPSTTRVRTPPSTRRRGAKAFGSA